MTDNICVQETVFEVDVTCGDVVVVGTPGVTGERGTIEIGTVTTVAPDQPATVENIGTVSDAILDFEIPRGSLVSVGTTSTVEYGVPASVTNSGVDGDSILNFSIPSGPISKVTEIRGRTTLDSAVDTVAINISGFTETTDILYVFVNSIYVSQGQDYTVSGANIVRSSGTWAVGTVIDFVCLRSILAQITPYNNAGSHNSIYRGKYLGSSVTAAQYAEISAGTFADMYIGDYWTIGGVNYRIAAFNYFLRCGDTDFNTNHITLVPDAPLYNAQMNTSDSTTGAYVGSAMRVSNLASAIATIGSAFSGHVKTHRQLLANATSGGKASGWAWYDASVEIMNEVMVYGCSAWGGSLLNNGFQTGTSKTQLPLFALRPDMISNRNNFWLRDVADSVGFAIVDRYGYASYYYASTSSGVRPAFSIS